MDKAIEAAARAIATDIARQDYVTYSPPENWDMTWPWIDQSYVQFEPIARAAIRAYLSALKEDPEVVERVGKAMLADELAARPHRDFDETWAQEDLIWLSNARAALSALEVE